MGENGKNYDLKFRYLELEKDLKNEKESFHKSVLFLEKLRGYEKLPSVARQRTLKIIESLETFLFYLSLVGFLPSIVLFLYGYYQALILVVLMVVILFLGSDPSKYEYSIKDLREAQNKVNTIKKERIRKSAHLLSYVDLYKEELNMFTMNIPKDSDQVFKIAGLKVEELSHADIELFGIEYENQIAKEKQLAIENNENKKAIANKKENNTKAIESKRLAQKDMKNIDFISQNNDLAKWDHEFNQNVKEI